MSLLKNVAKIIQKKLKGKYLLTEAKLDKKKPEVIEVGVLIAYERPQPTMAAYDQLLLNTPVAEVIQ